MLKKLFISLILSVSFCFTSFATPYIIMNKWSTSDYQEHCSLQGINPNTGQVIWNTYLGSGIETELSVGDYLGINNGFAYAVFDGSVYVLDPETGYVLLVNSDYKGRSPAWTFSSSGKLYLCGYYGPDLFVMDTDGKTLCRVNSFNNKLYWPYYMMFTTGNNLLIEYDGYLDDTLNNRIIIDVTKYFGIIER